MPKITYVHPDGESDVLDVPVGTSVMEAAIEAGLDGIVAECGGNQMCATCHVYVQPAHIDRLPPMEDEENEMLDATAAQRLATSRLSCQLVVEEGFDGLVVDLPESQT